jgi:CBS domain-containing protein
VIVSMYMTEDVATVSPRADGKELIELLTKRRLRRVPVADGGKLVGIV